MNRRGFLSLLGLGIAGVALEQAIPLGRVWSFPKEIVIARPGNRFYTMTEIYAEVDALMVSNFETHRVDKLYLAGKYWPTLFSVGDRVEVSPASKP